MSNTLGLLAVALSDTVLPPPNVDLIFTVFAPQACLAGQSDGNLCEWTSVNFNRGRRV